MEILLTYDVDTTSAQGKKRLRQVAKICEAYGQRVQKSVFELVITAGQLVTMQHQLQELLTGADSLRMYQLPQGTLVKAKTLGPHNHIPEGQPWVL